MAVTIPTVLVLIACKTFMVGAPDQNGFQNRDWVTKDAQLVCRREIMPMADQVAELTGAPALAQDFSNPQTCARMGMNLSQDFDGKNGDWYLRAVGCPTPIMNHDPVTGQDSVIGYEMPPCPAIATCQADPSAI